VPIVEFVGAGTGILQKGRSNQGSGNVTAISAVAEAKCGITVQILKFFCRKFTIFTGKGQN